MNDSEKIKIKTAEMQVLAEVHKDALLALRHGVVSELTLCAERYVPMPLALNEIIRIALTGIASTFPATITAEDAADKCANAMRDGMIKLINDMRSEGKEGTA